MNLEKELKSIKAIDSQRHTDTVAEMKLILEGDVQEDLRIMRSLADNSTLIRQEESLGRMIQLENLEKEYGEIYTIDQIRNLCMKYQLRFLSSRMFKGTLPMETISKLKAFAKSTNISIDEYTLSTMFYIIAPVESFSVQKVSQKSEMREKDPVLFYKIDDIHYRMIHKWGNDFSPVRRIKGWYWQSEDDNFKINLIATIISVIVIISYTIVTWGTHLTPYQVGRDACIICIGKFLFIIGIIILGIVRIAKKAEKDSSWYTEENWNSTKQMVK